jgi:hypothetical protein
MKTTTLLAGLATLVAIALVAAPVARADDNRDSDPNSRNYHYQVTVKAGQEVLARDHHNWTRQCKAQDNPPITVTRKPASGTVEVRAGDFEVKRSLGGNDVCFGRTMPGNGVFYKAGATPGADSFHYQVVSGTKTKIVLEFEVQVTVE